MENRKDALWTKEFTLLWITNLLMAMGFYFLLPTLPKFAVASLGASTSQVGYIIGIYTLSAMAIRPLAGYALDSVGRKVVYLWALGIFALLMLGYNWASSLIFLLLLRILHGFSWGITTVGGGTIIADILPPQRRGEGVGYFGLSMALAMAVGPGLGLWLMGEDQFGRLFTGATLLVCAGFFIANLVNYPTVPLAKRPLNWNAFIENRVLPVSLVTFFATLVYGGIVSFITIYSDELGVKNAGIFFLVYAIALGLVRPQAGRLVDRKGPGSVITAGFIVLICGFITFSMVKGVTGFLAAAAIFGIGNGLAWPTLQTMVINMVEPNRRGVANSTYMSALDLGIGLGSILLGWVADLTSLRTMYFVSAIILIIPLLYFHQYALKHYNAKVQEIKAHD